MKRAIVALLISSACAAPIAGVPDASSTAADRDAGTNNDAGTPDAGSIQVDAGTDGGRPAQCTITPDEVTCPMRTLAVPAAAGIPRDVNFQLPTGTPPPNGWPVFVLFQGSFAPSQLSFSARSDATFGLYYQALLVARLLDAGYAVLAPEAHLGGTTYWDTNTLPWAVSWDGAPDDVFMKAIFAKITDGSFGALDPHRWFAGGISSGGYMTSRMAVSYSGRFTALVVHSASYATCGPICTIPALPSNHPPTLFLHGEQDPLAPPSAMRDYAAALTDAGIENRVVTDAQLGHQWLPVAPSEILSWVAAH
ncbi:MAG: hypothetical protein QM817_09670 [Archangium sp.]